MVVVVKVDENVENWLKSRRKENFLFSRVSQIFFFSRANETLNRRGRVGSNRYLGATIMRRRNTRV